MSGLAQAQLFSSDRVCKPRVAQPPVMQEGFFPVFHPVVVVTLMVGNTVWMIMKMCMMMIDLMIGICCCGSGGSVFCVVG